MAVYLGNIDSYQNYQSEFYNQFGRAPLSFFQPTADRVTEVALPTIQESNAGPYFQGTAAPLFLDVVGGIDNIPKKLHGLVNAIKDISTAPGLHVMSGATSSVALITGLYTSGNGYVAAEESKRIGDGSGKLIGRVNMFKGGLQSLGGAIVIPYKAIEFTVAATGIKTMATAMTVLSFTGTGVFSAIYLLSLLPHCIALKEQIAFRASYREIAEKTYETKADKYQALLNFLTGHLKLTDQNRDKIAQKVLNAQESLKQLPDSTKTLKPEDQEWIKSILFQHVPIESHAIYRSHLEKEVGLVIDLKEALFERAAGTVALKLVKEEGHKPLIEQLGHSLQVENKRTQALEVAKVFVAKIDKAMLKKHLGTILKIGIGLLSIAALIAATTLTMGIPLLIITAVVVAVSLTMLGIDIYQLSESFKTAAPNRTEKIMMVIATTVLALALVGAMVFSAGPILFALYGVAGLIWFLVTTYTLNSWYLKKQASDNI